MFLPYDNTQASVSHNINIRLVELSESSLLCSLTAVNLADLETAERERQLAVVLGNILCQRYGQIESQGQIAVALGEAVDLLFSLAAALGEQHIARFDDGRVERGKAIDAVGRAQHLHKALHLGLRRGKQLHKAG